MFQKDLCKTVGGVAFTKFDTICNGQKIDRRLTEVQMDARGKTICLLRLLGEPITTQKAYIPPGKPVPVELNFFYPVHKLNEQNGPASIINLNPCLKHEPALSYELINGKTIHLFFMRQLI